MTAPTAPAAFPRLTLSRKAIFSPLADFVITSGLSIVVVLIIAAYVLLTGRAGETDESILPKLLLLQVLLNWPHFVISYRLLYGQPGTLRAYPFATMIVPAILIAVAIAAMLPAFGGNGPLAMNLEISYVVWVFAALYLAWHYTGQTWGMMMTFSHLSGLKIGGAERMILRNGLRVMILWHVIWGIQTLPPLTFISLLQTGIAMQIANALAVLAFLSGAVCLYRVARTHGSLDIRILGAWAALYCWYLLLWLAPEAFLVVQLSHALQYMIFPARVELNTHRSSRVARRLGLLYAGCVAGGLLIFWLPEIWLISPEGRPTIGAILGIMVNIHHYYTDSAIWKLRRSDVQSRLFAHLAPAK